MKAKILLSLLILMLLVSQGYADEKKAHKLSEIIQIGLENNPSLAARFNEAEAKKAAYLASKRLTNPELEIHKGRAKSYDGLVSTGTQGISISQYLENPFKRYHRIQSSKSAWQATEHLFEYSKLEIIFEIKRLFFMILLDQNREALAQKNYDSIRDIHQLIKKRADLGEVKELEAIKLHVETLKAQNELVRIQTDIKLNKENLNKFLGNSLPPDYSVIGSLKYSPLTLEEESLITAALLSHPLLKKKGKESEMAKYSLNYVRWQRFPDFKLSGFINEELDGRDKGFGISLDLPIWNFKSKEIAEAENMMWKHNEEFRALELEITTEIRSKLSQLRLSEKTIQLFHTGLLKQAEESLKISEVSYKQGEISLIDYLDSQRTYYSILKDYQESLNTWSVDKAALEKTIGEAIQ